MPGYILHITAAKMLFDHLQTVCEVTVSDTIDHDAFQVGNLIPDSVTDKTFSHFRHPARQEKLMVYPDLDLFLDKYLVVGGAMALINCPECGKQISDKANSTCPGCIKP